MVPRVAVRTGRGKDKLSGSMSYKKWQVSEPEASCVSQCRLFLKLQELLRQDAYHPMPEEKRYNDDDAPNAKLKRN